MGLMKLVLLHQGASQPSQLLSWIPFHRLTNWDIMDENIELVLHYLVLWHDMPRDSFNVLDKLLCRMLCWYIDSVTIVKSMKLYKIRRLMMNQPLILARISDLPLLGIPEFIETLDENQKEIAMMAYFYDPEKHFRLSNAPDVSLLKAVDCHGNDAFSIVLCKGAFHDVILKRPGFLVWAAGTNLDGWCSTSLWRITHELSLHEMRMALGVLANMMPSFVQAHVEKVASLLLDVIAYSPIASDTSMEVIQRLDAILHRHSFKQTAIDNMASGVFVKAIKTHKQHLLFTYINTHHSVIGKSLDALMARHDKIAIKRHHQDQ